VSVRARTSANEPYSDKRARDENPPLAETGRQGTMLSRAPSLPSRAVTTFDQKDPFSSVKKSQVSLLQKTFPSAFQAYDEGSIPFTRSNFSSTCTMVIAPF
jgi:hypothetical protein